MSIEQENTEKVNHDDSSNVSNRQITAVELFKKIREYEKRNNCDLFLEFASDESGAAYNGSVDLPDTKFLFCFKDIEELIEIL